MGGVHGYCQDRVLGVDTDVGREDARVGNEEPFHIMALKAGIHDTCFRIGPHPACPKEVCRGDGDLIRLEGFLREESSLIGGGQKIGETIDPHCNRFSPRGKVHVGQRFEPILEILHIFSGWDVGDSRSPEELTDSPFRFRADGADPERRVGDPTEMLQRLSSNPWHSEHQELRGESQCLQFKAFLPEELALEPLGGPIPLTDLLFVEPDHSGSGMSLKMGSDLATRVGDPAPLQQERRLDRTRCDDDPLSGSHPECMLCPPLIGRNKTTSNPNSDSPLDLDLLHAAARVESGPPLERHREVGKRHALFAIVGAPLQTEPLTFAVVDVPLRRHGGDPERFGPDSHQAVVIASDRIGGRGDMELLFNRGETSLERAIGERFSEAKLFLPEVMHLLGEAPANRGINDRTPPHTTPLDDRHREGWGDRCKHPGFTEDLLHRSPDTRGVLRGRMVGPLLDDNH